MKQFKFIWSLMERVRIKQVLIVFIVILYVGLNLVSPLLFSFLIDNVVNNQPITDGWLLKFSEMLNGTPYIRDNLWIGMIIVIVINIMIGCLIFVRGKWNAQISETVSRNLRNKLYKHLQLLPYSYHVKASTGELIQRCTSDVDVIRRFLAGQFSEMVYSIATAVIAVIVLFNINASLAIYACISLPFIFLVAYVFFKRMQKTFRKQDESEGYLSTTIQENLSGIRVVKAFNREKFEIDKLEKKSSNFRDLTYKVIQNLALYWAGSDLLCLIQIGLIVYLGVLQAQSGNISTGDFFVFVSYEGMILWPIRSLGRILSDLGKMNVSISRIQEILDAKEEDIVTGITPDLHGDIVFDHVSFQYDDGDSEVVEDISFTAKKGQTIAIMGPTGSGKSSLVHLLTRLYDPTGGKITINGYDITTISKQWLRKNVGIVLQEPFLFSRSIMDNIRIANKKINVENVKRAAMVASVHDVIQDFDLGYDTLVGEKGVTLSGGQKQRIAIARTIVNEAPILIFDDSLSAVDTQTDAAIRASLNALSENLTTFIITQRVSSAQNADLIIILEDKKISQMGKHEDLIRQPGLYKRIYELQNRKVGD